MAKPVLLTVDDDPEVLRAVVHDLHREYGDRFRVLQADSGATALETLKKLKLRNQPVALFLVDQRMPQMTGVEFLERAMELFPEAKRVLLTAYADTDVGIRAINTVKIDYYLLKPWDPPKEHLYPVLNDLLEIWQSSFLPSFEGIRVIGRRWSPKSQQIRDFLARNQVPYQWLDIETDEEARYCVTYTSSDTLNLPLVLFPDGSSLTGSTNVQIAEKIGLKMHAERPFYDLVIVGAGPAGLAAAVYGASEGLRTVLIEREAPGGQAGTSPLIENYLGFPIGLSGSDLTRRAVAQAKRFGTEILVPQKATSIRVEDPYRFVMLADGTELSCYALVIATGVFYRKLDIPGIDALNGAGVYYGVAMPATSCRDEEVFIVGAGNSAGEAALYFSEYARSVTILVRGNSLAKSMASYLIEQIEITENIRVQLHSSVVEVKGESKLEAITIDNTHTGEMETVPATILFIFVGAMPCSDCLTDIVERDEQGFILSGPDLIRDGRRPRGWTLSRDPFLLETNVPGIFVAGDIRHGSIKRVASTVGEGSIAIQFIHQYLSQV
jgi:thioredoxin reductase (NADPH)